MDNIVQGSHHWITHPVEYQRVNILACNHLEVHYFYRNKNYMINKQSTTTGCGLIIISSDFSVVILPHRIKRSSPDTGSCVSIGCMSPIK